MQLTDTPQQPTLSLVVLRVSDIERSMLFYSVLGLNFQREQHNSGPTHYSTSVGPTILELYPASERFPVTATRLGFAVESVEATVKQYRAINAKIMIEPQELSYGLRAVVIDPDGHRIELT